MLKLQAPAKINLVLEVLGKRTDGYHEIKSIMQTVSLFDVFSFDTAGEIELNCTARELQQEDNLVLKAARILRQAAGYQGGALITLEKEIPLASGLGGGSSDAAATLLGLNSLWSLGLPHERLAEIAAGIGSDVAFFIYGGTCLAESRGERIFKLPDIRKTWFVLLKPALLSQEGKTGKLYGLIESGQYSNGQYTERMKLAVEAGDQIDNSQLYNVFDSVVPAAYPGLDRYYSIFSKAGAGEIHLAGSGPVLFTALKDEIKARDVHARLVECNVQAYLAASITGDGIG